MKPDPPVAAAQPTTSDGPVLLIFDQVNAYQTRLLDGIRSVLSVAEVPYIVYANDPFARRLRPPITRLFLSAELRGVITTILTDEQSQHDLDRLLGGAQLPSVRIGAKSGVGPSVAVDNTAGMRAVVSHLVDDRGCETVCLVRGLGHHPDAVERESVVREELAARGLPLNEALVVNGGFDRDVSYRSMSTLLARTHRIDAVIALNDRSALGVLEAIQDAGLRSPDNILVTGFDDDVIAQECTPTLTTVNQELFAQGTKAAVLLLDQLHGTIDSQHVQMPATLIIRDSTRRTLNPRRGVTDVKPHYAHALASLDRGLAINRAFMGCRTLVDLLTEFAANISRLSLIRCFVVINDPDDTSRGTVAVRHATGTTRVTLADDRFVLAEVLPHDLRHHLREGALMLQPLSVEGEDLGYVLFEQSPPDRFVPELVRMDLSRAIHTLQRNERYASSLERLVALRTAELQEQIAIRARSERELQRAHQELVKLSRLDALTAIANRSAFDLYLDQQWDLHRREQRPLSLLLIDVDNFKEHNDEVGHLGGDECLRFVAKCLRDTLWSPDDMAARYGGDEFVGLLPGTDAAGARAVAERLQRAMAGGVALGAELRPRRITVSVGVATVIPTPTAEASALVALADRALYRAKESGRDQIVQSDVP